MIKPEDIASLDLALSRAATLLFYDRDGHGADQDNVLKLAEDSAWDLNMTSGTAMRGLDRQLPIIMRYCLKMRNDICQQHEKERMENAELMMARKRIIDLQEELLSCKNSQATVKTSVADSVNEELKTDLTTLQFLFYG